MDASAYREMAALEHAHWWHTGRRRILAQLLPRYAARNPQRIAEIGCGTGGNLAMLGTFAPVIGIEMSDEALAQVPSAHRAQVEQGALPDRLPVPPASCDWVCLLDVLEHVDDEIAALRASAALLRPGGTIVLTVPAYDWLWSAHDATHHHRRRYTRGRLLAAATLAGLRPRFCSYFNTWLFPFAVAARLKDRLLGRVRPTGLGIPPWPVNLALREIFASEGAWLRRAPLPFGLSLVAVLEAV